MRTQSSLSNSLQILLMMW